MITLRAVTKQYGTAVAVDGLNLDIAPGKVTGFLGPNGAGKSTTMRMIMGLDNPTSGEALINGKPYAALKHPLREVGALLDAKALHPGRSAHSHLLAMARSNGISRKRVDEVLEIVGLEKVAKKRSGSFSLGMGQRLGIASALLGDPEILLFDEPVNGLDPDGVRWVRELMRSLAEEGRTVFVSSHLMSEMQLTADHLVVIGRGKLLADDTIDRVIARSSLTAVRVRTPDGDGMDNLVGRLEAQSTQVQRHEEHEILVSGVSVETIGDLAYQLGIRLHELRVVEASLEEAYMEMTANSIEYKSPKPAAVGAVPLQEQQEVEA
ncbi:putative ABC transporter ATP-binding protein [Streptomyces ambofaciens ATCC 23877]|uniref:Putative ABC transporter ATP-binding protein n=1 Tax=Streptomyces ambofaciens (strain ATCC 23877 / 3486 / DSM 40053 / JCM 4204 / NBRC 12836 / NRRL B-2516) TaxID=278992 RepID=A0A0K2B0M5_STRA7|nr:ABC transporter ATP-binding protein [Streptomyces ambofaciens]AKZ58691.1 putative ABC transporter ATP-binding protein [Streptomyces ambofaciens ATCC 23877]